MTKPDRIESAAALDPARSGPGHPSAGQKTVPGPARALFRRAVVAARPALAAAGLLAAALWALYPVVIILLVIGFMFAGAASV